MCQILLVGGGEGEGTFILEVNSGLVHYSPSTRFRTVTNHFFLLTLGGMGPVGGAVAFLGVFGRAAPPGEEVILVVKQSLLTSQDLGIQIRRSLL